MSAPIDLAGALDAVAAQLDPPPTRATDDGITVWSVAGRPIVTFGRGTASFRVGSAIGDAARRTPDAGLSPRGPDWVAFSPGMLDDHARDRLEAWFAAAHRRAAD